MQSARHLRWWGSASSTASFTPLARATARPSSRSYVVANEETMRRGVMIPFLAAGMQALTAIALAQVLLIGLNATA